jgi:hypothetical protein
MPGMMRNPNLDVWDTFRFLLALCAVPISIVPGTAYLLPAKKTSGSSDNFLPFTFAFRRLFQREKPIMSSTFFRWGKKKDKHTVVQRQLPVQEECGAESGATGVADPVGTYLLFNIVGELTKPIWGFKRRSMGYSF